MKFLRIGPPGAERPVVAIRGRYFDLRPITAEVDARFLAALDVTRIAETELPEIDIRGARIGAPIARPGAVVCIGMNYAAHAAESGATPPSEPVVFYKAPNTVVGPDDEVLLPRGSAKTDWEVELGVIIGRRARYLESPEQALEHVAGYAVSNDVSERAFQLEISGGQWSKGKSCETFNPLGPWLVSADEIPDPQALRLRSAVNGQPRQDSGTADMIFSVATLIHRLSQVMVLEPGDLLNTGTPEGVALSGRFPYLTEGDVMSCTVEGLGTQQQRLRSA
ncbi:fumarylacetoacetate hydrolase family protein [Sciscionella marina]|uniref:fumarylacetoacetate hydrolase family protein n=1 Tax=Sciscionella marina TaxID=508770 RepID=UPI000363F60C|nr:fumarylacetoacetate hydrolase family protein [Sciscionella marina]